MRRLAPALACLVAAACIPAGREPPRRPAAGGTVARPADDPRVFAQCQADLLREGVRFQVLPDRLFPNGCSATSSVKLLAIGIPVTNLGAVRCPAARALARWVREDVQPAATAAFGVTVARMESFGSFACRPVNNVAGARLSEHAFANAVDIAAFTLADGRRITVERGWQGEDDERDFLRRLHRAACRRFPTVIGPDGDARHYNHFHMDMGGRGYCR